MPQVDRFSVSLDTELLAAFDRHIADRGYRNRSEAVRDLIRDLLAAGRAEHGTAQVVGVLTVVCDHRETEAPKRLRACLVKHSDLIAGSLTVPVDAHRDTVAIALHGPADRVEAVADQIGAMRGVRHRHLSSIPVAE